MLFVRLRRRLLTFFIRLMVPESERWLRAKAEGVTTHWATRDMLGVVVGVTGPLAMIYLWAGEFSWGVRLSASLLGFAVASGGFMYPVLRFLRRGAPAARLATWRRGDRLPHAAGCLSEWCRADRHLGLDPERSLVGRQAGRHVAARGAAGGSHGSAFRGALLHADHVGHRRYIGTSSVALMGNAIGRRPTYMLLCLGALLSSLVFFQLNDHYGGLFLATVLLAGGMTASFYGWLPLYLPELFPTAVRHEPRLQLQLWSDLGSSGCAADRLLDARRISRRLCPSLLRDEPGLPGGHGTDLARPGNARQTAARMTGTGNDGRAGDVRFDCEVSCVHPRSFSGSRWLWANSCANPALAVHSTPSRNAGDAPQWPAP